MPSTARDRTQEFFATISTFQTFNTIETLNVSVDHQNDIDNTSQEYIEQSHRIHHLTLKLDANIHNVSHRKLQQIEQLAKRSNNLHNHQAQINALMVDVNDDLYNIDQNIHYLTTIISKLDYYDNTNCSFHHQALLKQLKLKNEDLKKLYRSTYDVAISSLKRQKKQTDQFGTIKRPKKPINRRKYKNNQQIGDQSMQTQMQSQLNIVNYNSLRLDEATKIVSEITKINEMTIEMAQLVHGHGKIMGIIEENMDVANQNMDGAIGELQKYLARMTGNEMLMLKVFALIIFFAIFFAIFIA